MEPTHDPRPHSVPAEFSPGELIVVNGRVSGMRRALQPVATVVGRAHGCDVRLDASAVSGHHCLLLHGPDGLTVRDLQSKTGTQVNGIRVTTARLRDGDLLSVGPFRFKLHLVESAPKIDPEEVRREREAVRIQAAAVVAQQAALMEEETRLQQRRTALEQQETQLAAHLDEKRRRLVEVRNQARQAHATLQTERATHEERVAQSTRDLDCLRAEMAHGQQLLHTERRRLLHLRRRLKQRMHRHWAAERAAMRSREYALEKGTERLDRERAAVVQERLSVNGDRELGKRQLQAAWSELQRAERRWHDEQHRQQAELRDYRLTLEDRETRLVQAQRSLADAQSHWEDQRLQLEQELEGLNNRVANLRRKIVDQQEEVQRLEARLRELHEDAPLLLPPPSPAPLLVTDEGSGERTVPALATRLGLQTSEVLNTSEVLSPLTERSAEHDRALVERVAGELADQRLQLAEQLQRLVQAQQAWLEERDEAAAQLEEAARRLHAREQTIATREQQLTLSEEGLRQRQLQAGHVQCHLDSWQTRLTVRVASWEAERGRVLGELQTREDLAERRLVLLLELRRRWGERCRDQLLQLHAERQLCSQFRKECTALRQDWLQRRADIERAQRRWLERTAALEQFHQECVRKAPDSKEAEKRLEQLRKQWNTLTAGARRALAAEHQRMQAEAERLQKLHEDLEKKLAERSRQEADWTRRLADWDHSRSKAEEERARTQHQYQLLQMQRDRFEQQSCELRDEVERLVRVLLDEGGAEAVRVSRAA